MNDKKTLWIMAAMVLVIVVFAVMYVARGNGRQLQSQTAQPSVGGWWSGLWNNAANIVDAGGRHTAAATTSLGNAISSIIATSKSNGKAVFSEYGYSDRPVNYGPYVLGGAVLVAAVMAVIILLKK